MNSTTTNRSYATPDWKNITVPYIDHRKMANALYHIGEVDKFYRKPKAKTIRECGNFLEFAHAPKSGDTHLIGANFCQNRLCPMCAWRRRVKVFAEYRLAVAGIALKKSWSYVHLTLTVRNTPISTHTALSEAIISLTTAYRNFRRRLVYADDKQYCLGTHGQLEITINQDTESWHPHIHVLLLLDQKYYKTQDDLLAMWRKCVMGTPAYNTAIKHPESGQLNGGLFIEKVRASDGDLFRAVAETCKYPIKFCTEKGQLLIQTKDQYQHLQKALYRKRTSWDTGLLKKAKSQLDEKKMNISLDELIEAEKLLVIYTLGYRKGEYHVNHACQVDHAEFDSWRKWRKIAIQNEIDYNYQTALAEERAELKARLDAAAADGVGG